MKNHDSWAYMTLLGVLIGLFLVVLLVIGGCAKSSPMETAEAPLEGHWQADVSLRGGEVMSVTTWGFEGDRFGVWQVITASQDTTGLLEVGRTVYEATGACIDLSLESTHCLRESGLAYQVSDGSYVDLGEGVFHLEAIVFPDQGKAMIQGRVYERMEQ